MAGDRTIQLLRRRIDELDAPGFPVVAFDSDPRVLRFLLVLGSHTHTAVAAQAGYPAVTTWAEADDIVSTCRLLKDIARDQPHLIAGPLERAWQHWVGTARQAAAWDLASSRFSGARDANESPPSTKPFDLGLYTSTPTSNGRSMWRTYLDSFRGSSLHPLPWYTWEVQTAADTPVLEITRASEWVSFIEAYPRVDGALVYPDWHRAAADFDGVHITLPAIAATQGFCFPTTHGLLTAAAYWDLESTLWLRWCFSEVRLVEITE